MTLESPEEPTLTMEVMKTVNKSTVHKKLVESNQSFKSLNL